MPRVNIDNSDAADTIPVFRIFERHAGCYRVEVFTDRNDAVTYASKHCYSAFVDDVPYDTPRVLFVREVYGTRWERNTRTENPYRQNHLILDPEV